MKLERLKIESKFRSLVKGGAKNEPLIPFEIQFRTPYKKGVSEQDWGKFHPFCLVGLNGSGKSNILEAIANIFYHLESCVNVNQPPNFEFKYEKSILDAYELVYYTVPQIGENSLLEQKYNIEKLWKVFIKKELNKEPYLVATAYPFDKNSVVEYPSIRPILGTKDAAPAKKYLPSLIIGYSSGENEILSIPFLKTRLLQYDEYVDALVNNKYYKEPESSMVYIDYEMSQAVLLSNLIFYNENNSEKDVLKPIRKELGIKDISRFRMNLRNHKLQTTPKATNYQILDQIIKAKNLQDDEDKIIDKFKNCATCYFEKGDHLVLDFWVNDATKKVFKDNFKSIFKLFQAFQLLYTLNYHSLDEAIKTDVYQSKGYYTDGKIPEPSPYEQSFHFLNYFIAKEKDGEVEELLLKNLSDGEQQFLHSLGICLMLKNRNALLLLDEPETHFNPDWRSKFIRTLKDSLEISNSNNLMRDILITSHSPFIISDCKKDKVLVFKNGQVSNPKINTYGTSVHKILEEVFGKEDTISEMALDELEKLKNMQMETLEDIQKIKEASRIVGESLEKVLLFRELLLKEKQIKDNHD